ncbi:MAG: hypothetical protein PVH82_12605 [Desulfobacteraceae bacterium]
MKEKSEAPHTGDRTPHGEIDGANSKKYLFDNPRNVKILLRAFFASLLVLLVIEVFVHKHPHFPWEGWHEFYAVFGFVACVALVLAAKYILRPLVKREEDYYD